MAVIPHTGECLAARRARLRDLFGDADSVSFTTSIDAATRSSSAVTCSINSQTLFKSPCVEDTFMHSLKSSKARGTSASEAKLSPTPEKAEACQARQAFIAYVAQSRTAPCKPSSKKLLEVHTSFKQHTATSIMCILCSAVKDDVRLATSNSLAHPWSLIRHSGASVEPRDSEAPAPSKQTLSQRCASTKFTRLSFTAGASTSSMSCRAN
mmetsp:Transcript_22612/g.56017  ORF Transcript_22612/g.56017 Transcript_22612/m.56017 type:complete len:210 (+) Transcript_22612:1815-2444(+)